MIERSAIRIGLYPNNSRPPRGALVHESRIGGWIARPLLQGSTILATGGCNGPARRIATVRAHAHHALTAATWDCSAAAASKAGSQLQKKKKNAQEVWIDGVPRAVDYDMPRPWTISCFGIARVALCDARAARAAGPVSPRPRRFAGRAGRQTHSGHRPSAGVGFTNPRISRGVTYDAAPPLPSRADPRRRAQTIAWPRPRRAAHRLGK